jgi:superfamily II DNA or RNA helicase
MLDAALVDINDLGLPDWAAAVAVGEEPPADVPEELVEDLRALGELITMPDVQIPEVELRSHGNFASSYSGGMRIDVEMARGFRSGAVWTDDDGVVHFLPSPLRDALDELDAGPPSNPELSARHQSVERELWWGRLRRTIEPFGIKLDPFLDRSDAVIVEKLKPRLVVDEDGNPSIIVGAPNVDENALTAVVHRFGGKKSTTTMRGTTDDGATTRQRIVFSAKALKGAQQVQRLRHSPDAIPYLLDAPETVLDPDIFDLSDYGDRVIGIGKQVYRVNVALADGGGFRLVSDVGGEPVTIQLSAEEQAQLASQLEQAACRKVPYVRFRDGWVRVPTAERLSDAMEPPEPTGLLIAENLEEASFSADDLGEGTLVEAPRPPGLAADFELLRHQRQGTHWLAGHVRIGADASDHGMLADDMGLGKTLQVLSVMSLLLERGELGPCLLVAPVSLLQHWEAEADKFFPGRFRNRIDIRGRTIGDLDLASYDIVLASYATVRSKQLDLGRIRWKLMVLDESHEIRTATSLQTKAILAMDAERRLALTGTPVQNSLSDLWSQFDFLAPGLLGALSDFRQRYQSKAIADDADIREDRLAELRSRLGRRILRRLKADELGDSLPDKRIERHHLPMSAIQEEMYNAILRDFSEEASPLKTLHMLQRACAEPDVLSLDNVIDNQKLDWLLNHLEALEKLGEKAIVFAEWYSLQDAIVRQVEAKFGILVDRINGKVNAGARLQKVDAFNASEGFGVMVLGPKAAGVGLNITGANHVFHMTRPWNPAVEAQATDRVYRIGQTRPVSVHLPIMTHSTLITIEEHLNALLAQKTMLANDLLIPIDSLGLQNELHSKIFQHDQPEAK